VKTVATKCHSFNPLTKLVKDNFDFLIRSKNFGCLTHLLINMASFSSAGMILLTGSLSRHLVHYCYAHPMTNERLKSRRAPSCLMGTYVRRELQSDSHVGNKIKINTLVLKINFFKYDIIFNWKLLNLE
jgi:hypothetical protein